VLALGTGRVRGVRPQNLKPQAGTVRAVFLLLLVYAQKPQNQPQLTLPSGQQLVVVNTPAMQMSQQSANS